jgi:23S rRNA pseudouridine1911/1915/1917 synthase
MDSVILAHDPSRLFLLKPPGLPVFPPHRDPAGDCLLRRLLAEGAGAGDWPEGYAGGIAHRLDTATAGLVVAARDVASLVALRAEFASGALRKLYRFHTAATVPWTDRVVTDEIAHHQRRKDKMVIRQGPRSTHRGRWYPGWTRFTALGGPWWRAEIRTGVMHQIRVHAAAHGLPLTGDLLYGGAPGPFVLVHERVHAPGWTSPELPASLLGEWTGARVILPG